jgi:hypothetical protein
MEEKRKEKLKAWLKDPYNLALVAILIFAFLIRFYYFFLTKNQPLWWDESEYTAYAKTLIGKADYTLGMQRLPGFPIFLSIFYLLGFSEPLIRFFAVFIPSILVIFLIYLVVGEMYSDKRIALISTAIMAVLWEHLFYSNRFHTENFALIFELLAIFILFKVYVKGQDLWFIKSKNKFVSIFLIGLLSFISVLFRPGNLLFIPAILLFLFFYNKEHLFKIKILAGAVGTLVLGILAFIILPDSVKSGLLSYYHPENPLAFNTLNVFHGFYQSVVPWIPSILFYALLFGFGIFVFDFIIKWPLIKQIKSDSEHLEIKADIFNILLIICVLSLFIFVIRPYQNYEYRWFFPLITGMLVFTSKGIINFSEYVSKLLKCKKATIILILIILALGLYTQVVHADQIIRIKLESYSQVREAALWMKENSNKDDIIFSISHPQTSYYSERKVISYSLAKNDSDLENMIKEYKPKYLTVSIFEQHPEFAYTYPQRHNDTLIPVKVYTMQTEQGDRPVLIVYEVKH